MTRANMKHSQMMLNDIWIIEGRAQPLLTDSCCSEYQLKWLSYGRIHNTLIYPASHIIQGHCERLSDFSLRMEGLQNTNNRKMKKSVQCLIIRKDRVIWNSKFISISSPISFILLIMLGLTHWRTKIRHFMTQILVTVNFCMKTGRLQVWWLRPL